MNDASSCSLGFYLLDLDVLCLQHWRKMRNQVYYSRR